jgi:hypothetical protein
LTLGLVEQVKKIHLKLTIFISAVIKSGKMPLPQSGSLHLGK